MEQIILNLIPKGLPPICHASQYDKGRAIRLVIMDGLQGYYFTDETVELEVRKPDNNVVTAAVDVIQGNSYVDIVTTEQMTACEGDNLCELVIYKGDIRVGSLNFKMRIEVDPLKDGIESETEIHNLTTQIQDINEQIVPDMVAEEVANQYDSQNVIFDDTPTENHGTGYAVTSEGVKNALDGKPDNLSDLGDVNISSPTSNQALVYNPDTQEWENGEVSTVGSIDDLDDVDTTGKAEGDSLRYNGTEWVAQPTTVKLTLAEYNALTEKAPNTRYIITDAPALEYTADDLSYDGGTETTKQKIDANTQALTPQTIAITPNTSVATGFDYSVVKVGKIVTYFISCQLSATISATGTVIASGLPKAIKNTQIPVVALSGANAGQTNQMAIMTDGNFQTRYSSVATYPSGAYILASGSYITSE